jgi:hypothetical protein
MLKFGGQKTEKYQKMSKKVSIGTFFVFFLEKVRIVVFPHTYLWHFFEKKSKFGGIEKCRKKNLKKVEKILKKFRKNKSWTSSGPPKALGFGYT